MASGWSHKASSRPTGRSLDGKPVISWSTASRDKGRAGPRHRPTGSTEKAGPPLGDAELMGSG